LKDKGITLDINEEAVGLLIEKGFDPVYGARPLKRTIQRLLEDPLSEDIISGKFLEGSKIHAVRSNDIIIFEQ